METQPALIDVGANLTHDSFDADRDKVIARAFDAGVVQLVVTGASEEGSRDAVALAERFPGRLFATCGVHPHHARDFSVNTCETLRALMGRECVVSAGECGLDYFRDFSPRDIQQSVFRQQLEIAAELELPVFLHQRDAHDDFLNILEDFLPKIPRAVAHCFTGERQMMHEYLALGLYIGITGWICDERRGAHLLEFVGEIPDDRLLLETDAPYLLPRTLQPKPKSRRNEPCFLPEILRVVANASGLDTATMAARTSDNARRFFQLPDITA